MTKQAEAARSLIAACGDVIQLGDADDKQLMVLGAAMEGSPIRWVEIYSHGHAKFSVDALAKVKHFAAANGLTVRRADDFIFSAARPGRFWEWANY